MTAKTTLCPFCQGNLNSIWADGSFSSCSNCQLLVRNEQKPLDDLNNLYNSSWNLPEENKSETGATTNDLAYQYVHQLLNTLNCQNFANKSILDFGAGTGEMSLALSDVQSEVIAVEPYGYDQLLNKGMPTYKGLDEVPESLQFDGIVSLDVVEHLQYPWIDLAQLYQRIKPGGWFFVSTPNRDSLNARLTKSNWREAKRSGHLYLFNGISLEKQLRHVGFKRVNRLHWRISYQASPLIQVKDEILRLLNLDGELRYIAFKD